MLLAQNEAWRGVKRRFDLCSQVEQFMETYTVKNTLRENLTVVDVELEYHSIMAQLFFDFCNKKYSLPEIDWIALHLDLYIVLGRQCSLTQHEFEVIFSNQTVIDYCNKGAAWHHNKTCGVFFLNWYGELLEVLKNAGRGIAIVWNADWVHTQLTKLDELRAHFPFCAACNYHKEGCAFWSAVRGNLSEILADSREDQKESTLNTYFKRFNNLCSLPKSAQEFKQRYEVGGI